MGFFDKLFGKKGPEQEIKKDSTPAGHTTSFSATTMTVDELAKLKVGDTVQLGNQNANKETFELKWIEANQNRFGFRVFDCREYAINRLSSTQNEEIAKSFLSTRNSDGREYVGRFPDNAVKVEVDLTFNCRHLPGFKNGVPDGVLAKAQTMEQKWDIYKYANFIFYVRSWTGELVYLSNYMPTDSGFKVSVIVLDESKINEDDPHFELKVVEYLIYSHVLNLQVPHPLPKNLANTPENIAGYSFSLFGNRGYYGTYE